MISGCFSWAACHKGHQVMRCGNCWVSDTKGQSHIIPRLPAPLTSKAASFMSWRILSFLIKVYYFESTNTLILLPRTCVLVIIFKFFSFICVSGWSWISGKLVLREDSQGTSRKAHLQCQGKPVKLESYLGALLPFLNKCIGFSHFIAAS